MKEEGNALFREKNFYVAGEHYTSALFVGKMLQSRFAMNVDKMLMSALFTNRAACCNKIVSTTHCVLSYTSTNMLAANSFTPHAKFT